jgi:hypothetical protein
MTSLATGKIGFLKLTQAWEKSPPLCFINLKKKSRDGTGETRLHSLLSQERKGRRIHRKHAEARENKKPTG